MRDTRRECKRACPQPPFKRATWYRSRDAVLPRRPPLLILFVLRRFVLDLQRPLKRTCRDCIFNDCVDTNATILRLTQRHASYPFRSIIVFISSQPITDIKFQFQQPLNLKNNILIEYSQIEFKWVTRLCIMTAHRMFNLWKSLFALIKKLSTSWFLLNKIYLEIRKKKYTNVSSSQQ